MRTNVQLDHSQFITRLEPYQEKLDGEIDYVPVDHLVNFASVHQPDLPRNRVATLRLYQQRIELKANGYPPLKALQTIRGAVSYEFSRKSRRRLMNAFHAWQCPDNYKRYHVILTYPAIYSEDWHIWKDHLKAFKRKLEAVFGDLIQGYWRLELQKRGAPHYHLFIALPKGTITNRKLKNLVTKWWANIAHVGDQYEGKYATKVKVIHDDAMAALYISKYCAKIPDKPIAPKTDDYSTLGEIFDSEVAKFRENQVQQKSVGRHWGRIGKPNESPLFELSCDPSAQIHLKQVCAGWLKRINERYAERIENIQPYLSYNVYGIKGIALVLADFSLEKYLFHPR